MKGLIAFLLFVVLASNYALAQDTVPQFHIPHTKAVEQDTITRTLGDTTKVRIITHLFKKRTLNILIVHDNENTGVEAAYQFMKQYGGRLTELQYGSIRNIPFQQNDKHFGVDPNGIFSKAGIRKRLLIYNEQNNTRAINQINAFGKRVIKTYSKHKPKYIVTMHNNTQGFFDINSYNKDPELIQAKRKLYINPDMDPDDFVYVTDNRFFNYFKKHKINVILQSKNIIDDGSLSVYAGLNNIPYINIEIQHSHLDVQYKILCMVNELLHEKRFKSLFE